MGSLLQPLLPILNQAIKFNINNVGLAKLSLHFLGDKSRDDKTAELMDESIEGGLVVEALDGLTAEAYVKKWRTWAEEKAG